MQDNTFYNRQSHRFGTETQRRNSFQAQEDSLSGMVRPASLTRQNQILGREQYSYDRQCLGYGYGLADADMDALNGGQDTHLDAFYKSPADSGVNTKANIKQYIFSTLDNVLGGGQSSTAQIAQNMSAISNNLSNVTGISHQYAQYQPSQMMNGPDFFASAPNTIRIEKPKLNLNSDLFGAHALEEDDHKNSLSPTLNKQQKLFDNASTQPVNMQGNQIQASNITKPLDQSLFNSIGVSGEHQSLRSMLNQSLTAQNNQAQVGYSNSSKLFQNAVNYEDEEFQIRKMKSYNDAQPANPLSTFQCQPNKQMSANENNFDDQSNKVSSKKRSRKAYTKKSKKLEQEMRSNSEQFNSSPKKQCNEFSTQNSVRFAQEVEEISCNNDDSLDANNENTLANDINVARLTNKKKQYLQDAICDKNGAYSYLEDPVEYKKARKRLQNRESAVRSRQRKKSYQEELEQLIDEQNVLIKELKESQAFLKTKTSSLSNENQVLKQQVSYFQENLANNSLVGGLNHSQPQPIEFVDTTINQDQLDQLKADILAKINSRFFQNDIKQKSLNEQEHLIQPQKFERIQLDKLSELREDNDSNMFDDFSELPTEKKTTHRPRLYSGCIQKSISGTSDESHDSIILKRENSSSMHSKGYFCLAVLFGMMCASSLTNNGASEGQFKEPLPRQPTSVFSSGRLPKSTDNQIDSPSVETRMNNLNLISSLSDDKLSDDVIQKMFVQKQQQREKKVTLQNTAHIMKSLSHLNTPNMHNVFSSGMYSGLMKSIMSGKYSYLTHLMCSTACFFFWMTPNAYKMRHIRPNGKVRGQRCSKSQLQCQNVEMNE